MHEETEETETCQQAAKRLALIAENASRRFGPDGVVYGKSGLATDIAAMRLILDRLEESWG